MKASAELIDNDKNLDKVPGMCLFMEFNSFSLMPKCPSEISSSYLLVLSSFPEIIITIIITITINTSPPAFRNQNKSEIISHRWYDSRWQKINCKFFSCFGSQHQRISDWLHIKYEILRSTMLIITMQNRYLNLLNLLNHSQQCL